MRQFFKSKSILFVSLFSLFYSIDAKACQRTIVTIDGGASFNHHVNFNTSTTSTESFSVTHAAPSTNCPFYATFDYGVSGTFNRTLEFGGNTIPYNVYKNATTTTANILRFLGDISGASNIIFIPFFTPSAGSQTINFNYVAEIGTIPAGLPPGIYTDALVLGVYTADGINTNFRFWRPVAERGVTFSYTIEEQIDLYIVPTGDPIPSGPDFSETLNFETLQTGQTLDLDMLIETNTGYNLFLESTNGSVLEHANGSDTIAYEVDVGTLNGSLPTSPTLVSSDANVSPAGGFRINFEAEITGTVDASKEAGSYTDVIDVTVTAF